MNEKYYLALAAELANYGEIAFLYYGYLIYIQERTESGYDVDIGRRIDNEEIVHLDGGIFDGTDTKDAILFAISMADIIVAREEL